MKAKLEKILNTAFVPQAKFIPEDTEDVFLFLENSVSIPTTLKEYTKFGEERIKYIKYTRKNLLKGITSSPITLLLAEKLADILFSLQFLDKKYSNSILIGGESPEASRFAIDVEYLRTLLMYQLTYICHALNFSNSEIEEIYVYPTRLSKKTSKSSKIKSKSCNIERPCRKKN